MNESNHQAAGIGATPGFGAALRTQVPRAASPQAAPRNDLEPISLVEDEAESSMLVAHGPKKIQALGNDATPRSRQWKRELTKTGTGASRVKSFHGKYSEQGLEYLDNAINDWLDANPEFEVKFVTSTVMTFEGKIREPALVLNLWY